MDIIILQTIEEFTSAIGNKFGIYLVEIDDVRHVISRNGDNFYTLIHIYEEDKVWRVTKKVKDEMLRLLSE
jgi:hypothetical protein